MTHQSYKHHSSRFMEAFHGAILFPNLMKNGQQGVAVVQV